MLRWHVYKNYDTRHNNDYVIPMFKTNIVKHSLSYVHSKVYTSLTNGVKGSKTCSYFKYMVKPGLMNSLLMPFSRQHKYFHKHAYSIEGHHNMNSNIG